MRTADAPPRRGRPSACTPVASTRAAIPASASGLISLLPLGPILPDCYAASMNSRRAFLLLAAALALPAGAQTFPTKPVRIIVVYPPGGTSDAVTRFIAEKLSPDLAQQGAVPHKGGHRRGGA